MIFEYPTSLKGNDWKNNDRICEIVIFLNSLECRISIINFYFYKDEGGYSNTWKQIII